METTDFMELREVENEAGTDAHIEVFLLGVRVHTIPNAWTRPGGHVHTEKEQCVQRVQRLVKHLWDLGGTV